MIIMQRPQWWDGSLWFRTYSEGGFDGWQTTGGRRMPCDTMRTALAQPSRSDEIRQLIGHGSHG